MSDHILEVEHLKKSYVKDHPILDDISFAINKGEVVVLLGPSGCGKSTFLRCLNQLESIDEGVIKLNNVSFAEEKKQHKIREKIGMVFQSYDLFPNMTIMKNLVLAPCKVQKRQKQEVEQEAAKLLSRVGLAEKADSYPRQLSGGQKQRVAIVRALLMHPEILLLDEPLGALDAMTKITMQEELARIRDAEKMTMVLVTHDLEEAIYLADRVIILPKIKGDPIRTIEVTLPRPRERSSTDFVLLRQQLMAEFGLH